MNTKIVLAINLKMADLVSLKTEEDRLETMRAEKRELQLRQAQYAVTSIQDSGRRSCGAIKYLLAYLAFEIKAQTGILMR